MFCKLCGKQIDYEADTCVECQQSQSPAPAQPAYEVPAYTAPVYEAPVAPAPVAPVAATEPAKMPAKKAGLVFGILAIVFAIVGLLTVYIYQYAFEVTLSQSTSTTIYYVEKELLPFVLISLISPTAISLVFSFLGVLLSLLQIPRFVKGKKQGLNATSVLVVLIVGACLALVGAIIAFNTFGPFMELRAYLTAHSR